MNDQDFSLEPAKAADQISKSIPSAEVEEKMLRSILFATHHLSDHFTYMHGDLINGTRHI